MSGGHVLETAYFGPEFGHDHLYTQATCSCGWAAAVAGSVGQYDQYLKDVEMVLADHVYGPMLTDTIEEWERER